VHARGGIDGNAMKKTGPATPMTFLRLEGATRLISGAADGVGACYVDVGGR